MVDALKDLESMNLIINDVNVLKTTEAIVSDYFVEVSPGASKVKWKEADRSSPILLNVEGTTAVFTINVSGNNLEDSISLTSYQSGWQKGVQAAPYKIGSLWRRHLEYD